MSVRIEQYDGGEVLYIALDPDGIWSKSEFPDELVTVDFNAQGRIIGIETLGSVARAGATALLQALSSVESIEQREAVRSMLEPLLEPAA